MAILFCTSKYRAVLEVADGISPEEDTSNGLLGPWYANTLSIRQQRFLHYMSSRTYLAVVIWLREVQGAEQRMRDALRDLLCEFDAPAVAIAGELNAIASFTYRRATDRSQLASMRDQMIVAKNAVRDGRATTPQELMIDLARMPLARLGFSTTRDFTVDTLREHM